MSQKRLKPKAAEPPLSELVLTDGSMCRENAQMLKDIMRRNDRELQKNLVIRKLQNRKYHREYGRRGKPTPNRKEPLNCECCGKSRMQQRSALALDHCHTTGKFRGWLCSNCNTAIGKLGDTVEGLQRAIDYLNRVDLSLQSSRHLVE